MELRTIQTRVVPGDFDSTMRSVIETMHDLGYRITRVAPEAGVISGTRSSSLRLAVVVQSRGAEESAVRANASVISQIQEAQVDSPEFYQRDFFVPLGDTMGRSLTTLSQTDEAPDAARPVAELNTLAEREAQAKLNTTE
ncbi:hypothetical protein FDP22_06790 [Paroceanicella profunda]|uniref:Uncharacterized protein n=1 Tax=Paroceanicella profunda TaxID=2579971 RepID=A0A5B8FVU2_9RHOB|nr:hypothetical protein [Paroceanicella profunda]QDL91514.1 hypothetical protein FDP22_06790 [Paroceanicella profunda]